MKRGNLIVKEGKQGQKEEYGEEKRHSINNLITNLNISTILKAYRFSYLVKIQKLLY